MSRQASFHTKVSLYHQDRQSLFLSLMSLGRLPLLFVIALFLTYLLAAGNVTAEMLLFQSPQSPPAQPPVEQPPAQPPAEQPPAQPPTEQPPAQPQAEQPPAQPPAEQPPAQPPAEQPPAQPPAEQPPAQPPAEQSTIEFVSPLEPGGSEAPLLEEPPLESLEMTGDEASFENEEQSSDLVLDEVELIDTVVVSGAYIWLCCGVALFLLVPLFLLLLYIRGRGKITQEEGF